MTDREQSAYQQIAIENVAAAIGRNPEDTKRSYLAGAFAQDVTTHLVKFAVNAEIVRLQVEDVLVTNWTQVKDNDYKQAVNDLVTRCIQIENDPLVSVAARNRELELQHLKNNQWPCGNRPNPCVGYSSDGVNVYGDDRSMREVRNALHDASTLPQLRERVQQAEQTIKDLEQKAEDDHYNYMEMMERNED